MKLIWMILASASTVASCTSYLDPIRTSQLGDDPVVDGGTYTSGGGLTIAADIRENDGHTLLCGAWAESAEQSILTKGKSRDVVASGAAYLGRERIAQNLLFMARVAPTADYGGSVANCRLVEREWRLTDHAKAITIRIPRQVVYRDVDGPSGGAFVYFHQTGPGAGEG
ncbi:hypothetical protein [Roseovarius aestuarii]|uniref:Lipoprotein n=1 Tax=Roseovarius aestuarii TaxID=475083 RepID=A0A1X7BM26_9RHOB|nr:hypothetical protein [Roseovarius aestuarii]SMC10604.1 hypothetical protein ROA7745_00411 [Roseovarius aestuarii]